MASGLLTPTSVVGLAYSFCGQGWHKKIVTEILGHTEGERATVCKTAMYDTLPDMDGESVQECGPDATADQLGESAGAPADSSSPLAGAGNGTGTGTGTGTSTGTGTGSRGHGTSLKANLDFACKIQKLGFDCHATGDYKGAEQWLVQGKQVLAQAIGTQNSAYAAALNNLALVYSDMGDHKSAEALHLESKDIRAQVLGIRHPDYASTLNNLANAYLKLGNFKSAELLYLESKDIRAQALGTRHPDYARTLNNLAILYKELGDFKSAKPLYLESKHISAQALGKRHPHYAKALLNLANLFREMGDFKNAELLYLESRDIRAQVLGTRHPDYATALSSLANLYMIMGDFKGAEPLFLESKHIRARALGTCHPDYASTLNDLAILYKGMGDFKRAELLSLESRDLTAQALGTRHRDYAKALNNLATLYTDMGDLKRAELLFLESKALRAKVVGTRHPDYAAAVNNLASLYFDMGVFKSAERLFLESKDLMAQALGTRHPDYAMVLHNLAKLYLAMGEFESCFDNLTRAAGVWFEAMVLLLPALPERRMLEYIKRLDLTVRYLVTVVSEHAPDNDTWVEQCCNFVSSCKNVVFDAQMPMPGAPSDSAELSAARWELSRLVTSASPVLEEVGTKIDHIVAEVEQLEVASGRDRKPRLRNYLVDSVSMTRRIADALPANAALAEYAVSAHKEGKRYVVFVITGGTSFKVNMLNIGRVDDIDTKIQDYRKQLSRPGLMAFLLRQPGAALREILLDPVVEAAGHETRHLFVVPDGELATLPFVALPSGQTDWVLHWDMNISYLSSSRDLLQHHPREPKAVPNRSVVIANPDYGSTSHEGHSSRTRGSSVQGSLSLEDAQCPITFGDLPWTEKEGQSVKHLLQDADLFTRRSANLKALLGVSSPRVLHVAAHGFFLPAGETKSGKLEETVGMQTSPLLRSGLALAGAGAWQEGRQLDANSDNGIATSLDILSMDLDGTELATISACRSGLGDRLVGQGVSGLGRSLRLAGAQHVVLSLWDIQDEISAEIMKSFYTTLQEEATGSVHRFSEAMRAAQRKVKQDLKDGNGPHGPQLWAAFVVYGV